MGMIAGVVLTFAVFVYMFWPEKTFCAGGQDTGGLPEGTQGRDL